MNDTLRLCDALILKIRQKRKTIAGIGNLEARAKELRNAILKNES
jgi:hypothetical protein